MAIMSIVLYVAAQLVTYAYNFYRYTDESITLQREGLSALQALTADLTISHQRSVVVKSHVVASPTPSHNEDQVVIPLPQNMEGTSDVNNEGATKWMSVVGYEIDTSRPTRNLIRYLGDTIHDSGDEPHGDFWDKNIDVDDDGTADGDYIADIEAVDPDTQMPTVGEIKLFPATGLRTKSVCRHVFEFKVRRSIDTVEIDLTVLLPGKVRGGQSLDNSLKLTTTVLPRN